MFFVYEGWASSNIDFNQVLGEWDKIRLATSPYRVELNRIIIDKCRILRRLFDRGGYRLWVLSTCLLSVGIWSGKYVSLTGTINQRRDDSR